MEGDIKQEMIWRRSKHNECVLYTMVVDSCNLCTHINVILVITALTILLQMNRISYKSLQLNMVATN